MTLVEVAVAAVVLTLLVLLLAAAFKNVSLTVTHSRSTANLHLRLRMAFNRIGEDLAHCVKRNGLDWQMVKHEGNDRLFFFSRVPGYFITNGEKAVSTSKRSCLSLIGYGIGAQHQLVRLDKGLTWRNAPDAAAYSPATISERWPKLTGVFTQNDDADYFQHVLSPSTFRIECALLMKDGTVQSMAQNLQNPLTANAIPAKKVSAVVVTIAALEPVFRARVKNWRALVDALPDAPPGHLALREWSKALDDADYFKKHEIPATVAAHVWIYQRCFPIP